MVFPEQIEFERLLLRWPTEADAEEIFARYGQDSQVSRYMSWKPHPSVSATREHIERWVDDRQAGVSCSWLLYPRGGGPLLGSVGFRVKEHLVQFGYCLARDVWGQGYATEAARAIVATALAGPAIWRVQAYCDVENRASARVLEKAGLTFEGTFRRYLVLPNLGDVPRDIHVYARVRNC